MGSLILRVETIGEAPYGNNTYGLDEDNTMKMIYGFPRLCLDVERNIGGVSVQKAQVKMRLDVAGRVV